jgi:hypothetical protein
MIAMTITVRNPNEISPERRAELIGNVGGKTPYS